jgi:glycosyltransferase involved in cell wall biosynthesis
MIENTTFLVKTFNRPECIERLVDSIPYDNLILIANDGNDIEVKDERVTMINLPYDSGLSHGRNEMVKRVTTENFLLLDDDFVFNENTRIERMKDTLDEGFDIVAGRVYDVGKKERFYHGCFELNERTLNLNLNKDRGEYLNRYVYDFCLNFFIAKTAKILPWDKRLKTWEHEDFFLRNRNLKITLEKECIINHEYEQPEGYVRAFKRKKYKRLFKKIWELDEIKQNHY